MPYAATTVAGIVDKINRSHFLPAIQRPFVWEADQVELLFDSILKGYPISSFLFWDVNPENREKWDIYNFSENFRYGEIHNEKTHADGRDITLVLDGQQRLTSLLIGLRGSYTVKAKSKRWDNPSAWSRRRLYLDLLYDPARDDDNQDGEERRHKLQFFEQPPERTANAVWFRISEIMNYPNDEKFDKFKDSFLDSLSEGFTRFDCRSIERNLDKIYRSVWKDEIISFYTEKDQDYERVLRIFIRANDGGTKLSKSDLLMSMVVSRWGGVSGREEIYSFVYGINMGLRRKNKITKDFVMKASLLLSDLDHKYDVNNFTNENIDKIRSEWGEIKSALRQAFLLLNEFGIDGENLTSLNAVLPIAYYLKKSGRNLVSTSVPEQIQVCEDIRKWIVAALLNNVFGGRSDATIAVAKKVIQEIDPVSEGFPIKDLISSISKHLRRDSAFSVENMDSSIQFKYGQKSVFLLLSIIYPERSWGLIDHHIDHIFPKSLVNRRAMMNAGMPLSEVEKIAAACDRVGNLQIIPARDNLSKTNIPFEDWINTRDSGFADRHMLPPDRSLWVLSRLPEFVEERERMLRERIVSLYGMSGLIGGAGQ